MAPEVTELTLKAFLRVIGMENLQVESLITSFTDLAWHRSVLFTACLGLCTRAVAQRPSQSAG